MSTQNYELTAIFNGELEGPYLDKAIEWLSNLLTTNNAELLGISRWGSKEMAYPIKKKKVGYYVCYTFNSEKELLPKIDNPIKHNNDILRSLIIVATKRDIENLEKQALGEESTPSFKLRDEEDDEMDTFERRSSTTKEIRDDIKRNEEKVETEEDIAEEDEVEDSESLDSEDQPDDFDDEKITDIDEQVDDIEEENNLEPAGSDEPIQEEEQKEVKDNNQEA
ncbi:30S ribosomal protein S6 [bacterium]|nr:30S ribosomal protein S6 [bacterium]